MKYLIASALMLLFSGVANADLTIDASTEDSFNSSVEEIRNTLSDEEREKFDSATAAYLISSMMEGRSILEIGNLSDEQLDVVVAEARSGLDGKSAEDVIGAADSQDAENVTPSQASEEESTASNDLLEKFVIESANFFFRDSGYSKSPVIELKVTNNTGEAVSQAYFHGVLISPNRSVPWVDESFNYSIAGGIEPGETLEWRLAPNQFGAWGNTSIPDDAVLNIEVTRLNGADGQPLSSP